MMQEEIEAIAQRPTYCKADGEAVTLSRAERDALVAMARDGLRYQQLRRGQKWSVIDGIGDSLRADTLDEVIDAAMAKEQA
ncbi:hypothetical protein [Achromobacter marplatensis]|uniref:hypothetical protein n=1 Tax=Achromobacter marplatensis TaxID=470868 RepID=UPI0028E46BAA|nr:hypothetical protein [Achromobacter marplatensis]